eukprot:4980485-Alexandrium_andersonii.AAC.1
MFFRHSDNTIGQMYQVWNAVVRSKVMYGLESVVFNKTAVKKLDSLQLKGIRKILRVPTTYCDKTYTNAYLHRKLQEALTKEGKGNFELLTEFHKRRRKTLMAKIMLLGSDEPGASATWDVVTWREHDRGRRRVGHPRSNWTAVTLEDFWDEARTRFGDPSLGARVNVNDPRHREVMMWLAA